jgi:hypothetical protein
VKCALCQREMETATGCVPSKLAFMPKSRFRQAARELEILDRVPMGQEKRHGDPPEPGPCGDCGVHTGQLHHPGCDWDECPRCRLQLAGCDCHTEYTIHAVAKRDGGDIHVRT